MRFHCMNAYKKFKGIFEIKILIETLWKFIVFPWEHRQLFTLLYHTLTVLHKTIRKNSWINGSFCLVEFHQRHCNFNPTVNFSQSFEKILDSDDQNQMMRPWELSKLLNFNDTRTSLMKVWESTSPTHLPEVRRSSYTSCWNRCEYRDLWHSTNCLTFNHASRMQMNINRGIVY